jgi:tRNA(Ile)-lysidine synthetase-like protein
LQVLIQAPELLETELPEAGCVDIPGYRIEVQPAQKIVNTETVFTVIPKGKLVVRCRRSADRICLPGGTKTVKKLFIDRKIPAHQRLQIPVIADDAGIVGIYSIGPDQKRIAQALPAVQIRVQPI